MFSGLSQGWLKKFHGVEGGVLLRGAWAQKLAKENPTFAKMNNALWAAPAWKWGLAVVPLTAALTGKPSIEKIDLNNSMALAGTGAIWAYYSLLVRPKSIGLFSVSVALVLSNGWNVARRIKYDQEQKRLAEGGAPAVPAAATAAAKTTA